MNILMHSCVKSSTCCGACLALPAYLHQKRCAAAPVKAAAAVAPPLQSYCMLEIQLVHRRIVTTWHLPWTACLDGSTAAACLQRLKHRERDSDSHEHDLL